MRPPLIPREFEKSKRAAPYIVPRAEPDAAESIRKFDLHPLLWKVTAPPIFCPNTVGKPVNSTVPECHPHSAQSILNDCLEELSIVSTVNQRRWEFNSGETATNHMPQSAFASEPKCLVRRPVCEIRHSVLRLLRLDLPVCHTIKRRISVRVSKADPHYPPSSAATVAQCPCVFVSWTCIKGL